MEKWGQYSYGQGLNYCFKAKQNERLFQLTARILEILEIKDIPMNGFSIQRISDKVDEEKSGIVYSSIFQDAVNKYITPVYYVTKMVEAYEKKNIYNEYEMSGKVARGLRAFPSFIREMDLEYKLGEVLLSVESVRSPQQDIQDHTDVLLRYDGEEYRIWSYQRTEWGLVNTSERLLGIRGKLPRGFHILCPIDIFNDKEAEEISGWELYSDEYVQNVVNVLRLRRMDQYSEIISRSRDYVKEYIKDVHIFEKK